MWPFRNKPIATTLQTISCKIPRQDLEVATSISCNCLDPQADDRPWPELKLHPEEQDTNSPGWLKLLELVEAAVSDQRAEFAPARDMTPGEWAQIVTLPPSIARLKAVEHLSLYGSGLVRIPPEIGEMESLKVFTPYTSYRLHWFPYEITRCKNLRKSTVSTRALYGNFKNHPPFPRVPCFSDATVPSTCSVCNASFGSSGPLSIGSHSRSQRTCSPCWCMPARLSASNRCLRLPTDTFHVHTKVVSTLKNSCTSAPGPSQQSSPSLEAKQIRQQSAVD